MAVDAVYNYMKIQNRPYGVNDVVANLHNEFSKTAVQKVMDQLVQSGKLFEKVYGKQKIYCIVQDTKQDAEELMRIERELQVHAGEIQSKYEETMKEIREQEALLSSLKSSLSLEDAGREKATLKLSISQLSRKLDALMETSGSEDLPESKRKAESELDEHSREYAKRKRICTEIIDCILENYTGSRDELYEEVGIDPTTVQ